MAILVQLLGFPDRHPRIPGGRALWGLGTFPTVCILGGFLYWAIVGTRVAQFVMDASDYHNSRSSIPLGSVTDQLAGTICQACERATEHLVGLYDPRSTSWVGSVSLSPDIVARLVLFDLWNDNTHRTSRLGGGPDLLRHFLQRMGAPDGGWTRVPDGLFDLDTSVLGYLALRLAGHPADEPQLAETRKAVRTRGGIAACGGITRYYLALFGIEEYSECPAVYPESLLLPSWVPGSLIGHSHWSLAIQVPLAILAARRPRKFLNAGPGLRHELMDSTAQTKSKPLVRSTLELAEKWRLHPFRKSALLAMENWIVQRISSESGLAGSPEATLLGVIALIASGHDRQTEPIQSGIEFLEGLRSSTDGVSRSLGAVNDTALALQAILQSKSPQETPAIRQGIEWLLSQEISSRVGKSELASDRGKAVERSGWSREPNNRHFPSVPSTANVLLALRGQFSEKPPSSLVTDDSMVAMIRANSLNLAHRQIALLDRVAAASRRARQWIVSMQNPDGGWGHSRRFQSVRPTASHCDPNFPVEDKSTPASTGRVLMSLGAWEMGCGQSAVDRAVSYLRGQQTGEGNWSAHHDASEMEATWAALLGLRSVGIVRRDATIVRAADWIESRQDPDGGWPAVQDRRSKSQPLPTAWGIMALVTAGRRQSDLVAHAVDFLLTTQSENGSWSWNGKIDGNGVTTCHNTLSAVAIPLLALSAFEGS